MAGGERIELPSSESKSDELTVIQNPQYLQGTIFVALPTKQYSKFLAGIIGLEPMIH